MTAIEKLKMEVRDGSSEAQFRLGVIFMNKYNDELEAVRLMELSANGNNIKALLWLANRHRDRDEINKALTVLNRAKMLGSFAAQRMIDKLTNK